MKITLDKKQIRVIFLFEFKLSSWVVKTTCNINNAFGPGTANEHTEQRRFKKFCKGDEKLEDEECSDLPSGSGSSYNYMRSYPRTQRWPFYDLAFEANQKGENIDKWVPCELTETKISFWSVISSFCMQQQWTISQLDCDVQQKVDCIRQPAMTNSVVGPRINQE